MDRRQFGRKLALGCLLLASMATPISFIGGCAGVPIATFVSMGLQLIGTILPTIPGILAAFGTLVGKTITPAQVAQITAVFTGVSDLFQQAESSLTQFNASNDPTYISKIQDILGQIKSRLSNLLADVQIKDIATATKITSIVNAFVDLANNILTILPRVVNGKLQVRKVSHAQLQAVTAENWARKFNTAIGTTVDRSTVREYAQDVDAAFANVKAVVPPKQ